MLDVSIFITDLGDDCCWYGRLDVLQEGCVVSGKESVISFSGKMQVVS